MGVNLAITAIAAGIALVVWMVVLEKQPRSDLSPRRVPTVPIMFAGLLAIVVALAYLMSAYGIQNPRG